MYNKLMPKILELRKEVNNWLKSKEMCEDNTQNKRWLQKYLRRDPRAIQKIHW